MNIVRNNTLFYSRDYSEFDTPTIIRRQGRAFRIRLWNQQREADDRNAKQSAGEHVRES